MSKKKVVEGPGIDTTAWMVTFSDLLQLLLTFFVLLISMSSLDVKAVQKMFSFFPGVIGVLHTSITGNVDTQRIDVELVARLVKKEHLKLLLEQKSTVTPVPMKAVGGLTEGIGVKEEEGKIVVSFPAHLLFTPGGAKMNPKSHALLTRLVDIFKITRSEISVHGHTDNRPIRTPQFASNWELSLARAISVVEFFRSNGVEPERLSAVGHGEFKPLLPNSTVEHRMRNRRVEIVINQK